MKPAAILEELALQIRFWGARGLVRSLHYAILGSWAELWRRRPSGSFVPVGAAVGFKRSQGGLQVSFERAELELEFLLPDLLRVTWRPGSLPVPYALARADWPAVEVSIRETSEGWELASESLTARLSRLGELTLVLPDGAGGDSLLRAELPPERREQEWRHRARLRRDERAYGLGEHTGPLDLRGSERRLWNSDPMASYGPRRSPLYLNIPVYQVLRPSGGYLLFYENSHPATLAFDGVEPGAAGRRRAARRTAEPGGPAEGERPAGVTTHFEGGALRYYLVPGTPDRTLERYTELTGRPPLPPRWALGYHQSRFSYETEAEVREVADGFLERGLPLSAIHLDIHYMDAFRVFTVDPERFPDLGRLARDLAERGVRLVVILDPGVKRDPEYRVYRQGLDRRMFCLTHRGRLAVGPVWPGWSAFPDFTDSTVREWWGELYRGLVESGVSGFWNDMNEPTMTALWGERALAHDVGHAFEGRGGDHFEAHNLYGLLMARSGFEGLRRLQPERRPFLLSRSGWAGIQRYAWTWTGDISSRWPMLRQTIATMLGLGLSGMPYSGPDIGGFKGALDDELYLRWFELAALLPFCRTHSALLMGRREPWRFGAEVLERVRGLLELREGLLPLLYTLAWRASRSGHPLVRPLFWPSGADPGLLSVDDAFLVGDALLVAPVLEQGARRRSVRLPAGRWYGYWDDEPFSGEAEVDAPLGRLPLFVRAGAVLPRANGKNIELHLYAPYDRPGGGELFSDAGDGFGDSRLDLFELERAGDDLVLSWRSEGPYPFPFERFALRLHGVTARRLVIDGREVAPDREVIDMGPFRRAVFSP
jgi:alpha-glucosidase